MECTGGFKALRNHVNAAKESDVAGGGLRSATRYRIGSYDTRIERDGDEASYVKDQKELQERERATRRMEIALQESLDRVSEKETQLDTRIQEITRLESRLHDALTEQRHCVTTAVVPEQIHNSSKNDKNDHEEREAALVAQERLDVKERVLREKEAELNNLACELQQKETAWLRNAAAQQAQWELEREKRFEALERQLQDQHKEAMSVAAAELQKVTFEQERLHTQHAALGAMEQSFAARAVEVETLQRQARQDLDAMQLAHDQERKRLESLRVRLEATETALNTREHNLALFAHEVECQHQSNVGTQRRLDAELQKVRVSEMPDLRGGDGDAAARGERSSSTLRRSLTSSLFRSK
ncbi:hypothetical protein FI667_g11360, partial [Globisporangium splendens]